MNNLDLVLKLAYGTKEYTANRIDNERNRDAYLLVFTENLSRIQLMDSLTARVHLNTLSVKVLSEPISWLKHSTAQYRSLALIQLFDIVDRIDERFG